jgi:hypothetical protein
MSEVEQRREQLPTRTGDREDAARAARVRRSAWLLAGLAAFFYLGYIAWNFLRAPLGG